MFLPSFDSYFTVVIKFAYFIGLQPLRPDPNRKWFSFFLNFYGFIMVINILAMQVFFYVYLSVEAKDTLESICHIPFILFCTEAIIRYFFMVKNRKKLSLLLEEFRELYATPWKYNAKLVKELDETRRGHERVQYAYLGCNIMFIGGPILASLILYFCFDSKDLMWIVNTWRPFDRFSYAWLVFNMDMNAARFAQYGNTVPDSFLIMLLIQLNYHFECLGHAIQDVVRNLNENQEDGTSKVAKTMRDVVVIHERLINLSMRVNDFFSGLNFMKFITASSIICCTGFIAIFSDDYVLILQFIGFLGAMLIQPFQLCMNGDLLSEKSKKIADFAYESDWYNCKHTDKKTLHLLILRAQKPCYISVLDLAKISRETFKDIMTNAYQFFTLLKKMYK